MASWRAVSKSDDTLFISTLLLSLVLNELFEGIGKGDAEFGHPCCRSASLTASNGSIFELSDDDGSFANVTEGNKVAAVVVVVVKRNTRRVVASSCVPLGLFDCNEVVHPATVVVKNKVQMKLVKADRFVERVRPIVYVGFLFLSVNESFREFSCNTMLEKEEIVITESNKQMRWRANK